MGTAKLVTLALLLATLVVLTAWDIYVAGNKERGDTISEITLAASSTKYYSRFVWGFAFGLLTSHLMWPQVIRPTQAPPPLVEKKQ